MLSNPAAAARQFWRSWASSGASRPAAASLRPTPRTGALPIRRGERARLPGARAGLPGLGQRAPPLRGRRQARQARCRARALRRLARRGRDVADQLARRQSRGAETPRHRRREPRARAGEFRRRPGAQRRPAGAGRHAEIRRRQEPGDHAGVGRLSHPGDGADPVPADDRRCTSGRCSSPRRRSTSSMSSTWPEKSIIQFARGRPADLRHQLEEPTPAESHFGLDTYVAALEEAVDAMRDITGSADVNIWGSCSGGITMSAFLATSRRAAKPRFTAPPWRSACSTWRWREHDGRNVRHPGIDRRGEERVTARRRGRRTGTGAHVRLDAAQRPDLELLGEQLPARQCAARLRRPLLEQRHDAAARAAACRLPRSHRRQSLRQCRPARSARHAARHAPA